MKAKIPRNGDCAAYPSLRGGRRPTPVGQAAVGRSFIWHRSVGSARQSQDPEIASPPSADRNDDHGSILIACLIILSTLTIYGGVLISAVYERSIHVTVELDRLQAFYLAESALAKSIQEVKSLRDADGDGLGSIPKTKLGRGIFYAIHDPGTLAITGVGRVNDIERRVRIYYEGI